MNPTDDVVSQQLEQIKRQRELAELQANPNTYDRYRLPWESKDKYGKDSITVTDEDREQITKIFNDALGIVDQTEPLICETQPSSQNAISPKTEAALVVSTAAEPIEDRNIARRLVEEQKRGQQAATYDEELRHIARAAKGKRNYGEARARREFPDFLLWEALDNSRVSPKQREEFFSDAYGFAQREQRFDFIGALMGVGAETAYGYYKKRPERKKRRSKDGTLQP